MTGSNSSSDAHIEGFEAPMHRSLVEPILLGGAPRAIAIVNGTVAAAILISRRCSPAICASVDIAHAEPA